MTFGGGGFWKPGNPPKSTPEHGDSRGVILFMEFLWQN